MNTDSLQTYTDLTERFQENMANTGNQYTVLIIVSVFLAIALGVIIYQAYYLEDMVKRRTAKLAKRLEDATIVNALFHHDLIGSSHDISFALSMMQGADEELLELGKSASKNQIKLLESVKNWSKTTVIDSEKFVTTNITPTLTSICPVEAHISDLGDVLCEEALLANGIKNLVTNALNHNPREDREVNVYRKNNVIYIEDNGPGMTQEEYTKYKNPFQKGPNSTGDGMGLAIAGSIIDAHDFELEMINTGKGTTFKIHM